MRDNGFVMMTVFCCLSLIPLLGAVSAEQAKVGSIMISVDNASHEIIMNGSFLTFSFLDYKYNGYDFVHTQIVVSDTFPYADPFVDGESVYNNSIVMDGAIVNITGKLADGTSYAYINCSRPFNDSAVQAINYDEMIFSPPRAQE